MGDSNVDKPKVQETTSAPEVKVTNPALNLVDLNSRVVDRQLLRETIPQNNLTQPGKVGSNSALGLPGLEVGKPAEPLSIKITLLTTRAEKLPDNTAANPAALLQPIKIDIRPLPEAGKQAAAKEVTPVVAAKAAPPAQDKPATDDSKDAAKLVELKEDPGSIEDYLPDDIKEAIKTVGQPQPYEPLSWRLNTGDSSVEWIRMPGTSMLAGGGSKLISQRLGAKSSGPLLGVYGAASLYSDVTTMGDLVDPYSKLKYGGMALSDIGMASALFGKIYLKGKAPMLDKIAIGSVFAKSALELIPDQIHKK